MGSETDHESPKTVMGIEAHILNIGEFIVLSARYLLMPLYCAQIYGILIITIDFFKMMVHMGTTHLIDHTMESLQLLDITMIANLIWFISAGSYYIFVHPYPGEHNRPKPRALAHISTGILKEKMAGSLVGISSVHLLQVFLDVATALERSGQAEVARNMEGYGVQIVIHLVLIVGLLAFNHTNRADHQGHNASSGSKKGVHDHA